MVVKADGALAHLESEASRRAVYLGESYFKRGCVRSVRDKSPRVVAGTVQVDFSGRYEPIIDLSGSAPVYECGCVSPKPCSHLVALAHAWVAQGSLATERGWSSVLDRLIPNRVVPLWIPGKKGLVHQLRIERLGSGEVVPALSWVLYKPTRKGVGRGREMSAEETLASLPQDASAADLLVFESVKRGGFTTSEDGLEAIVHPAAVDAVLKSLSRNCRVRFRTSDEEVGFDYAPLKPTVRVETRGEGLVFSIVWSEADGRRPDAAPTVAMGVGGAWTLVGDTLRPVLGGLDGAGINLLSNNAQHVGSGEVGAFFGAGLPALEARGIEVEIVDEAGADLIVSDEPSPKLYLAGQGGVLTGLLRFTYGDVEVAGENPGPVVEVRAGGGRKFLKRDMEGEFEAVQRLRGFGFELVEPGRFEAEGEAAHALLAGPLLKLSDEWELVGREELKGFRPNTGGASLRVSVGEGIDWLDLEVSAMYDEAPLDLKLIVRALRTGSGYVKLGDGTSGVLPMEWVESVGRLVDELGLKEGANRLPLYMAPAIDDLVDGLEISPTGWERARESLLDRLAGADEAPVTIAGDFEGTLRPYQIAGIKWLDLLSRTGVGGVLADDMGLGKTVQTLAQLAQRRELGANPSLVVAPTSVIANWESEAARFTPGLRVVRYHGVERSISEPGDFDLMVTSYALLWREVDMFASVSWDYVVLDEAQAIKNPSTSTARAAFKLAAANRLALTGTPIENHLGELWSLFRFLNPGLLGSRKQFRENFAKPMAEGDAEAVSRLKNRVRPFVLRRLKPQVAPELPEKVGNVLWCEMGEGQRALYETLLEAGRRKVFEEVDARGFDSSRMTILETLLRLRQACCHPPVLPGSIGVSVESAKFDAFTRFVPQVIDEGYRLLVFSQFVKVLKALKGWYEGCSIEHLYMDGSTRERQPLVDRFQGDESVKSFLVSLKAGGAGLNLTGADYVILFDPWWNPAVEQQAEDRAHRIGRTTKVFTYRFITKGTVEEKIMLLQDRKRGLTEELISPVGGSGLAGLIGENELEELFTL